MTLPLLLLAADILLCWSLVWSGRLLAAVYMFAPVAYLAHLVNHRQFPDGPVELIWVASWHVLGALAVCWDALPKGRERGWFMLLTVVVAAPFLGIVLASEFQPYIMQDSYYMLTGSTMAATAIALTTAAYVACFKPWDRLVGPVLAGVYFGVDVAVNGLAREDPWNLERSLKLATVDHAVHLVVVSIALWLLHAERSARIAPSSPGLR